MQQPQFTISEKDVQFVHMNTRTEKHGDDDVLAVDLDMMVSTSNEALAMLHPTLRWSLYDKPDVEGSDLADQAAADLPIRLRYPKLDTLRWALELMNYRVTFHYGLGIGNNIVLEDCKVNKFKVECHDGGTIDLQWRVQANPTHEQIGRLSERLSMGIVSVTIEWVEPPEVQESLTNEPVQNPIDARGDDDDDEAPKGRRRGRQSEAVH